MRNYFLPLSRTPVAYRMPLRPSLAAIIDVLSFEWRVIAIYALGALLIGASYCLITPKVYEANVQIVPGDFTTKSTSNSAAGLANLLLNTPTQSDAVKRFVTVLFSPDLAHRLVGQKRDAVLTTESPGWLSRFLGGREEPVTLQSRVRRFERALGSINFAEDKKSLATRFTYRSESQKAAGDFLKLAVNQGDELLRAYNLSEIRYDDNYLNATLGNAQNVDVRMALSQKLVETQLRRMDAQRMEYFSVRTLGPVAVSDGPVWPRKKLILPGMLIIGTLAGAIAAFARVYARREADDNERA